MLSVTTFVGPLVYDPTRLNFISTRSRVNSLRDQSLFLWGCGCSRFHSALLFLGHTVKVYNELWASVQTCKIFLVMSVVKKFAQTTNYHVLQTSKNGTFHPFCATIVLASQDSILKIVNAFSKTTSLFLLRFFMNCRTCTTWTQNCDRLFPFFFPSENYDSTPTTPKSFFFFFSLLRLFN